MWYELLKRMILGKPDVIGKTPNYESWYNAEIKLWTAQFKSENGDQIGHAGYGPSKSSAIEDLFYQNIDILE